jgi:hypothetical protein
MELQEFSGSLNLLWLNQNAGAHSTYFWPWLLLPEKIAGHELKCIPDMFSMAWVFINPLDSTSCISRVSARSSQSPSPIMGATSLRERARPACRMGKIAGVSDDWVRGVNENGPGEGLDLMHKVLENAKHHRV